MNKFAYELGKKYAEYTRSPTREKWVKERKNLNEAAMKDMLKYVLPGMLLGGTGGALLGHHFGDTLFPNSMKGMFPISPGVGSAIGGGVIGTMLGTFPGMAHILHKYPELNSVPIERSN